MATPFPPKSFRDFLVAPFSDISFDKAGGFIRGNFFFLLWILIVPLLMFGVKQGWELLYGLFDDTGPYPGFRAASMLFIYFLLALAIWLLPMPFFPKATMDELDRLRPVTKDNPYRGLLVSSIPMIFYSIAIIVVQSKRDFNWWQMTLTLATIAAGIYGMWWVMERSKMKIGRLQFLLGMNWLLVFLLIWIGKSARDVFWNYYFIGSCILIQMALLGGLLKHLEAGLKNGAYKTHRRYYRVTFFVIVPGTLILSLVNNLQFLTPTYILLLITTCYVILNDLVIALYVLKKGKWLKYGLTLLLLFLAWFMLIRRSEIHNINYVSSTIQADARVDFHTYFEDWYKNNIAPKVDVTDTAEIPIFLVAAQGGGSRAGLWTSHLLNRLESESNYQFHRHLFAITSASGGSAGTGATLAFWRYLEDNLGMDSATRNQLHQHFAPEMFRRNYLSSQFMQLFVNEVGKRFLCLFKDGVYDRNLEHQHHEVLGFANAIRYGHDMSNTHDFSPFTRIYKTFKNGSDGALDIGEERPKIANYPMSPYLSFWYKNAQQPDTRLPLYFPVTTNIQTGKSGYASAIAWDSTLFVDAIDLIRDAEKSKPGHSLALVTTSNLSQLFPIMNSYTYIEGTGNFMDGGLFENMGLTLMCRIHERLKKEIAAAPDSLIPPSVKKRLKVKLLFFINDALDPREQTSFKPLNQMTATVTAVGFSSIQGTSTWWLNHFKKTLPPDEQPIEFVLQTPQTPEPDKVPLGRWLSIRSVDSVRTRVGRLEVEGILEELR